MVGGTAAGVIYAVILSTSQISQWEPGSGGGGMWAFRFTLPTLQSPQPQTRTVGCGGFK